ncbi:MAG: dUTP diphosphatase [Ignavibacteria bacterium]|jgi:dUTP pyrophosphatase|nr:dUTP diphosphatase [Ignavibacteria bacterium]
MKLVVEVKRISKEFEDLPLPQYQTEGSAGMDLYAAIAEPQKIAAGAVCLLPTNLAIALPPGFECQVRSRSGLAAKNGIFALNSPGTIDSDYRGEIKVILANFSKKDFVINRGERIAQIVVAKYEKVEWKETAELEETERGAGGFGSSGM